MDLDWSDIQGNILHAYKFPHVVHLFATIPDDRVVEFKRFLRGLRPLVADAKKQFDRKGSEPAFNVGFSYQGLAKLHAPPAAPISVAFAAFYEGMKARSAALGDPSPSREVPWDEWMAKDVWISIHGATQGALEDGIVKLEGLAGGLDFGVGKALYGEALVDAADNRFEHFGFRDGIANPAIRGTNYRELAGNGKRVAGGEWVPIAEGEFILGHPNERDENPLLELPPELQALFRNGTFAVFRDLEQHVEAFEAYIARHRARNPGEDVASKMVGRKPNGDPLAAPGNVMDFHYDDDAGGARCPIGSHIRRSNPRKLDMGRHRLIRRGMPYDTRSSKGGRRGMYFVAMNASIENQFEFLQKTWINGPTSGPENVPRLSDARDPIATSGLGPRRMLIEGDGAKEPILLLDIPQFVTCRGGQYFFMPGLGALDLLAGAGPEQRTQTRGSNGPAAARVGGLLS